MTFQRLLEDNDFKTRSYSGRGMFGKECLAVTVEDIVKGTWDIATMLAEYNAEAADLNEEPIPEPRGMRYDNMGRQYVIYWTQVPFEGEESEEEEESDEG
jgi:hypothetical protein